MGIVEEPHCCSPRAVSLGGMAREHRHVVWAGDERGTRVVVPARVL